MGRIEKGVSAARKKETPSDDPMTREQEDSTVIDLGESAKGDAAEIALDAEPLDLNALQRANLDTRFLRANRIVVDHDSPANTPYKMLRTRVLQRMQRNGWSTVAVTGTCPNEGKTLTAINLSLSIARDVSTNVVLVDLDLRKPSIHRYMGITPKFGIGEVLRGEAELEEAVINPGVDRLGLLLNEAAYVDSSELLSSPEMANLVGRLRQGPGRVIVFDLPPVLATDDMLAFAPLVDAVLLVVSQGTTKQDDLVAIRDLLQDANVVGTVLNRSSEETTPYYYGYSGGYR